ncbi:hypothetical protein LV164_008038 [Aspergillus fumigatus]|nr:hypothetical protein KXX32_009219 [Aspergillus fumigatus]KAH1982834.1 hypothetical protein KXW88_004026 [Aspergillus fumigatus]KAH2770295.1 hypothetical protein KXV94_007045 [Aspergillus fumigatus]KAH3149902.1 hypothetical protein KXW18_007315 [Aspergillus fumigatus]KAH3543013.1 hypothetical protein KXV64_001247 [Aspergillus fumigatus]
MPVQRLLRRSPLQCTQCSERQMQCSKTRPQCDGCRRHRLSCRYGNSVPSKQLRPPSGVRASEATPSKKAKPSSPTDDSSSSSSSSSYSSPSPPAQQYPPPAASPSTSQSPESNTSDVDQDDKIRVLDAPAGNPSEDLNAEDQRLLDNWCNSTEQSLAHSKSKDRPWQAIIRREASRHPALRHSTLALSAMELASTSEAGTPQGQRHLQAAESHYTQATEQLPNILDSRTASGPNAAFSTASILFMCDLASSALAGEGSKSVFPSPDNQTPASQESPDPSPSACPSLQKLLDLFDTIRALLPCAETLNKVETGALKDLFTQGDPYHQLPSTYTLTILSMKNLNALSARSDPAHETAVYNDTIAHLDNSLEMLTKGGDPTTIALRWMFRIPSRYLDLVREKQPLALIIFAHYCAVLHHLRDRWWMGDLGARLLKEICRLLGSARMGSILWATDIVGIQT